MPAQVCVRVCVCIYASQLTSKSKGERTLSLSLSHARSRTVSTLLFSLSLFLSLSFSLSHSFSHTHTLSLTHTLFLSNSLSLSLACSLSHSLSVSLCLSPSLYISIYLSLIYLYISVFHLLARLPKCTPFNLNDRYKRHACTKICVQHIPLPFTCIHSLYIQLKERLRLIYRQSAKACVCDEREGERI